MDSEGNSRGGSELANVIVAGWTDYGPALVDEVVPHLTLAAVKSRSEAGCLDFYVAPDPTHPGRVVTYERWADGQALETHLASDHVGELKVALAVYKPVARDLNIFDGTWRSAIGPAGANARQDGV